MKTQTRVVVIVLDAVIAAFLLYRFSYMPLRCNAIDSGEEKRILKVESVAGTAWARAAGEATLAALRPCAETSSHNANYYMIRAAAFQLLNKNADAAREYEVALQYDRRPEIYFNLGLVLLDLRRSGEGEQALLTGSLFNPKIIDDIPYDDVRESIRRKVNATFDQWSEEAAKR